ncbi:MAG: SGNH/GDSL hydrolase family protein [Gammaproteobacteria bacterium]|nr:SGNH/GDSL hydrolase family protein [Gammaproteobacteria bacterium]
MNALTRMAARVATIVGLSLGLLAAPQALALPYSHLYVFGDSLSDPGNAQALTGGAVPVSPAYYQGHFSNGLTASERLASYMGTGAHNYAIGGARTDNGNIIPGLPGLQYQVNNFLGAPPPADPNALFMVWAGGNDFLFGVADPGAAIANAVNNIAGSILALASTGAQRFFVPNLPDLGLTPLARSGGPDAALGATLIAMAFNSALESALGQLEAGFGLEITRFDTFGFMHQLVADPAAYGLNNVDGQCFSTNVLTPGEACADASGYLFWDDVHPSAAAHRLLAAAFAQALGVAEPEMAALMGLALLGLFRLRRRALA